MRNVFTRRRNAKGSQPLIEEDDYLPYYGGSAINPNPGIFSDRGTRRVNWTEDAIAASQNERKKNVGNMMRKLNCGASRRELQGQRYANSSRDYGTQDTTWGWNSKPIGNEIVRPVLITVKDGQTAGRNRRADPNKERASFVVGKERSGRFGFGKRSSSTPAKNNTTPRVSFKPQVASARPRSSRDMNDMMTSQERARRQRWRRGIEKSWKDDADVQSVAGGDESTMYGYSVGSTGSADTDYTTGSSDDSGGYSSHHRYSRGRGMSSPPRRHRSRSRPGNDVWSGVAEDMKIIAGMIMSDGTACVGSVAAITHETMIDSCTPQGA